MIKKEGLGFLITLIVVVALVWVPISIGSKGEEEESFETEDYRVTVLIPGKRILVEQIHRQFLPEAKTEDFGRYRSCIEIYPEAMEEVEKEYNVDVYYACPLIESGYPPVMGTWTKALILFVVPKEDED